MKNSSGIDMLSVLAALCAAMTIAGCAQDTVLEAGECGNGVRESGEVCDDESPGCVNCEAAAGYSCVDGICDCEGDQCFSEYGTRSGCEMDGFWAVRETAFSVDSVFPEQYHASSTWYVLEFEQTGDKLEVVENLSCGVLVNDWLSVRLTAGGAKRLLYANPQGRSNSARPPRRGVSAADGDRCQFELERWYFVRGLQEERGESKFLPTDFAQEPDLNALPVLPDPGSPATMLGAADWDGDGVPGLAWTVTGAFNGIRNTVQLLYSQYDSALEPQFAIQPGSRQFTVAMDFDYRERVLHSSDDGAMMAHSVPAPDPEPRATFLYLGRSLEQVAPGAAPLGTDIDSDRRACLEVSALLPHQSAAEYDLHSAGAP